MEDVPWAAVRFERRTRSGGMAEDRKWQETQDAAAGGEGSDSRAGDVMQRRGVANGEPVGDYIHLIAAAQTGVRKTSNSEVVALRALDTYPKRRSQGFLPIHAAFLAR